MHTLCTLFLGVCTPCADFFWVHAHFFQTLKIPPFSPSCTGSFRIPVSLIGLITSPTSLDRNSKLLFSAVFKVLKSMQRNGSANVLLIVSMWGLSSKPLVSARFCCFMSTLKGMKSACCAGWKLDCYPNP